jgi:hypothetical protein
MDNTAPFVLELRNAEGEFAADPDCRVEFLRLDNVVILRSDNVQFPPSHSFTLPAFPQAKNLHCFITPSVYQMVQSRFFTLNDGEETREVATVVRDPEKWRPEFTKWNALPAQFDALKAVLEGKLLKLKHGPDVGVITPTVYNGMSSPSLLLAKMALLNLYTVLGSARDPVSNQPWFHFVKEVLVVDRERFIAIVTSDLFESVNHIRRHLSRFKKAGFFPGDAALHHDNIPSAYRVVGEFASVKCAFGEGNTQFTVVKAKHADKGDCILLDCDMDEHNNVIEHASDVFIHIFSGGTHPITIHEYIVHHQKTVNLGYTLRSVAEPVTLAAKASVGRRHRRP